MFYSTQILAKKGPLGTIWIAAHLDKRLKRNQVFEANIAISVDSIINPEAPLALRLSGQLLLGVVKVYSKKVGYLFQDCNDALVKVKQAFKADEVDLPRDGTVAAHATITLPDDFNSLDFLSSTFAAQDEDDFQGNAVVPLKMGKRDSFLLADDVSLLLGSQSSLDGEERFEVSGDEMERHLSLSLGEPEQLRRNMTPASEGLYVGDGTPGSFGGDEQMEAPPDDLLTQLDSAARPAPMQEEGMRVEDAMPAPFVDDLGGDLDNLLPSHAEDEGLEENLAPAAQKGKRGGRKKRVHLDVGPDHRPATQLDGASIRALLKDRSALLRPRAALAERSAVAEQQRFQFGAADQITEEAGDCVLMQPLLAGLPPALRALCMVPAEPAYASPAKSRGHKSKAAEQEEAAEDHYEAAAPDQLFHDAGDAPGDMRDLPMDEPYDGMEPMLDGNYQEDGAPSTGMQNDAMSPMRSASEAQHLRFPGGSIEELGMLEGGEEAQEDDQTAFTARTAHVAARLKAEFSGAAGKKKRRLQSGAAEPAGSISLDGLVEGKTRADACRWFFEVLVLKSRDFVELEQPMSYGDISIRPTSRLLAAQ